MLDKSFFVSPELFDRTVTLPGGVEHKLKFRQVANVEFRRFGLANNSKDEDERAESIALLIAASLCNEDGSPALTKDEARSLTAPAANALFQAVVDVNNLGATKEGND